MDMHWQRVNKSEQDRKCVSQFYNIYFVLFLFSSSSSFRSVFVCLSLNHLQNKNANLAHDVSVQIMCAD